jgi:hypothetical protein
MACKVIEYKTGRWLDRIGIDISDDGWQAGMLITYVQQWNDRAVGGWKRAPACIELRKLWFNPS